MDVLHNVGDEAMSDEIDVLIYGFGGQGGDIAHLREYLDSRGRTTHMLTLAGHGGTKEDLHNTSHLDWLDSARKETAEIARSYARVNLLGFSMGGLLGIHLCEMERVNKLVLINTPIYCWNFGVITRSVISDLRSGGMENISYYMKNSSKYTAKSIIDFFKLLHATKGLLPSVVRDNIILQCIDDEIVHHRSADFIKEKIGGASQMKFYKGGFHQVFVKAPDIRDGMCEDIYQFLGQSAKTD
ncbi:MAG: alpha/beta fold hydrolase [Defluviitaleaceae bacterium]|nr:alpha/beta fold hydrolase [Defluviitaleaceae bacterium]